MKKYDSIARLAFLALGVFFCGTVHASTATTGGIDTAIGQYELPLAVQGVAGIDIVSSGATSINQLTPGNPIAITSSGSAYPNVLIPGVVGIGTVSPDHPLVVWGAGQFGTSSLSVLLGAQTGEIFGNSGLSIKSGASYGINFTANNNPTVSMSVSSTGNVGIGTTMPLAPLEVRGTGTASNYYFGATSNYRALFGSLTASEASLTDPVAAVWTGSDGGGVRPRVTFGSLNQSAQVILNTGGWDRLIVDATGNVGIGTASPQTALDVLGAGNFSGAVTAQDYFYSSDKRLKENIKPIAGLALVSQLNGVTFDWKKDHSSSAGVIAQDVEKVLPTAVMTKKDGYKAVEYSQLMAPMIEAIKELKAQNEELKAQVDVLKTEIKNIHLPTNE